MKLDLHVLRRLAAVACAWLALAPATVSALAPDVARALAQGDGDERSELAEAGARLM